MTKAVSPDADAPKPTEEATAPAFPVRPPTPTATFSVSPQTTASKLLGWLGVGVFILLLFSPGVFLADDEYWLPLFSRYMAVALFAVSLDLIWGYTGLLSLGQGVYFGIGAYIIGYSLKLQKAAILAGTPFSPGPDMAMPDFMEQCRLPAVPAWIAPLINIWVAIPLAILLSTAVAAIFGYISFRRRIKGVYFALITQALVLAAYTFVVNQRTYTGGVDGMSSLAKLQLFGVKFDMASMYYLDVSILSICFLGCLLLVRSKFGKILTAIRDSEYRVLALGYNTAAYKTFIFALAGGLAGLSGGLYVAGLGTTGPDVVSVLFSIQVVILVAVGGRGTLFGAVLGAVLISFAETYIKDTYQMAWPLILGGLFIVVIVFLPEGILGGLAKLAGLSKRFIPVRLRMAFGWGT